jgi:hypothetical protein
MLCVLAA